MMGPHSYREQADDATSTATELVKESGVTFLQMIGKRAPSSWPAFSMDHDDADRKFQRMRRHIRWVEHACKCTRKDCVEQCFKVRSILLHLSECAEAAVCNTCQYARSLCGFHSLKCARSHCRVPFCMNTKYKLKVKARQAKKAPSPRMLIKPLTTAAASSHLLPEEQQPSSQSNLLKEAIRKLDALSLDMDSAKRPAEPQSTKDGNKTGVKLLKIVQNLIDAMTLLMNPEQQQEMAIKFLHLIPEHIQSAVNNNGGVDVQPYVE